MVNGWYTDVDGNTYYPVSYTHLPQIFELYGTGTEKIYIKYERGGKVPEMGAEEDAAMLALRKRLERWKQSAWEAECAIFAVSYTHLDLPAP